MRIMHVEKLTKIRYTQAWEAIGKERKERSLMLKEQKHELETLLVYRKTAEDVLCCLLHVLIVF